MATRENPFRFRNHTVEWYTPAHIIEEARRVLGDITLDPASCEEANRTVQARRFFSSGGLEAKWEADTVWLNPPYGKIGGVSGQAVWSAKLVAEYQRGNVGEALLMVNAATETRWFQRLLCYPVCFVRGRVRFVYGGDLAGVAMKQPVMGSAVFYMGGQLAHFDLVFSQLGAVMSPGDARW